MIHAALIVNNVGKPRLAKFYTPSPPHVRAAAVSRIYDLICARPDSVCNFVELPGGLQQFAEAGLAGKGKGRVTTNDGEATERQPKPLRVCYRRFATLYFIFVIDENESELGILDLIQVFVESLDRCFAEVCELDLIFAFDRVHTLLSCMIVGGCVLDTNIESIASSFKAAELASKKSQSSGGITSELSLSSAAQGWDKFGLGVLRGRA